MEMDELDRLAANAFEGYIVRKDLSLKFKGQYPVPTYVGEFLLGRYCASTDEEEINEGLQIVERQLRDRTVRAGEEELFKSRARELGTVKLIDLVTARLDVSNDTYLVTLPSLRLTDVRIEDQAISDNERILTGGFYAEIDLEYDAAIAQQRQGRPFGVTSLRPIQLSKRTVLDDLSRGYRAFDVEQWKRFLLRSVGLEPERLSARAQDVLLLRMVPFVERNYNTIELGPRGTGKSHMFQQLSPYSHLVSGGKATVARMFVNNSNGQRGLVCQYDVVCFDEVSGITFDQKDGVNIMKGYMESGEFSRGRESIRGSGSIVMVGNFDVDVEHQQRIGHLFSTLALDMRDDTAFMDRIHGYFPGWDVPKMETSLFTEHFGLVSDFLSEAWTRLRDESRMTGGMLAYYTARDVRTGVVICTGGEEGEIHDPNLDPVGDRARLREIRTQEVKDACAILGVADLRMLGYRDSGMAGTPANQHPKAFVNAQRVEAVGKLVRIIRELRPRVIVTDPPGGMYPHPDHIMCHEITVDAFQAAGDAETFPEAGPPWRPEKLYGVAQIDDGAWENLTPEFIAAGFDMDWMKRRPGRSRGPGPETATVALDVRSYSEHQRRALLAHRTQVPPGSFLVSLPEELRRLAFATAYFVRLFPPCAPEEHEPDLLDGLDLTPRVV